MRFQIHCLISGALFFMATAVCGQSLPVPDDFLSGGKWGSPQLGTPATVTWSFQTSTPAQVALDTFMPAGYRDQVRAAFQTWSDVAGITFVEVASGGQIRLFGQAIDGPGGTAGQGQYPGTGSSIIRFDTGNSWTTDPAASGTYVYQLALHEIGHTIGLRHPPGIIAGMSHVVSRAFEGLLPVDVAGAQAIYGPSATVINSQYLPSAVRTLQILPTSQLTATVSVAGLLSASDSTDMTGTIAARIEFGTGGVPAALTFYGADIDLTDVSVELNNAFVQAQANFTGLRGDLFSKDWFGPSGQLTAINAGGFDVSQLVLGLIDGLVQYDVQVPALGIDLSDTLELYFEEVGPAAFGATDLGEEGLIERIGSDLHLRIPLNVITTLFVPANGGELPIEIRVTGAIEAVTAVPEVGTFTLTACAGLAFAFSIKRRKPVPSSS